MFKLDCPNPKRCSRGHKTCFCRFKTNENCSLQDIDLSALYAIIKASGIILPNSHKMWFDKIIKERNKLCHTSDLNGLDESHIQTMWGNMELAVIGLASVIPVELYKEGIEAQIELFKVADYSWSNVQPIVDGIKEEYEKV